MWMIWWKTHRRGARRPVSRVLSATAGSPLRSPDGHSSGASVAGRLARPTRATARKPADCKGLPCNPSPLFGLAPGGVYHAVPVAGNAVRSYRTLSPLPIDDLHRPAVCFLWHCPWGRPRRPLAGTVFPWSPDFPPPAPDGARGDHPAVWRPLARGARRRRQSISASNQASRRRHSRSNRPSSRAGRKWRWNASTTVSVAASNIPVVGQL